MKAAFWCGFQETPLHVASEMGEIEVVKLLIQNGADVNAKKTFQVSNIYAEWLTYNVLLRFLFRTAKQADRNFLTVRNLGHPLNIKKAF